MVLRLCPWRSHNLLPTFGTFHELENSLRMPINRLGNLMGSPGGPRKPTWRWNLKFFFMESISIIKGATTVKKRGWKSSKTKKFFFCTNTTCFYSVHCTVTTLHTFVKRWNICTLRKIFLGHYYIQTNLDEATLNTARIVLGQVFVN